MIKIPLTLFILLIFGFANSQNKQIIETSDIENFWKAFDKLKYASNKNDSINPSHAIPTGKSNFEVISILGI